MTTKESAIQAGGTAWNSAVYNRPDSSFWDNYFPVGWKWNDIKPYIIKVEDYHFPNGFYGPGNNFNYAANLRGRNGLLDLTQGEASDGHGFTGRFIDAVKSVFPHIDAFKNNSLNNGNNPSFGVAPSEHTIVNGVRITSYSAYIDSYTGSNLRSVAHVRVNKVLFVGRTAVGVQLQFTDSQFNGNSSTCTVNAKNIILSAGVFGTPKILKLSGVGPRDELNDLGIHVVLDQPEVGENIDDQFGVSFFPTSGSTIVPGPEFAEFSDAFYNVQDDPHGGNNLFISLSSFSGLVGPGITTAAIQAYLAYAESKGTVKLASTNPDDAPLVDPQYLSTLDDKILLARAVNKTVQVVKRLGVTYNDPCDNPSNDCSTLLKLLNVYLSQNLAPTPGDHWTSSAALGKVVNPSTLLVNGLNHLYVLDASILPVSPGQNSEAAVFAAAERGIQLIINQL
eukprot:TRINITY_DN1610_c0_g1_i12.p1 TRINITY_DN1610_c0_g1~~TRINITY_DN1610_c0_g1_i12.p1  ORF type:complete len:450 (-),score=94.47 TRINITY_DN1610_c0_g1_i12:140-1489(-)